MQAYQLRQAATFEERVRLLGQRLGPDPDPRRAGAGRGLPHARARVARPERELAFDFRHESWAGIELPENAVRVNDYEAKAPFRYLRFREPPYYGQGVKRHAEQLRPLVANGVEIFCLLTATRTSRLRRTTRSGCSN